MPDDVPLAAEPRPVTDSAGAGLARWHLFYAVVLAATAAVVVATTLQPGRTVALATLAAMVPWYLLVGRPLMTAGPYAPLRSIVYLAGLIVLFAIADLLAPNTWFLAFALNPHCYHVTTSRRALATVVVMSCTGAASIAIAQQGRAAGIVSAVCLAIFAIGFSVAYGGYLTRIVEQNHERAVLITQLEATRAELAEVSREAGVLAERQRLAGEIHDTLAQGFSSILMLIQAAEAQLDEPAHGTARSQLALAAQTARENLAEARTLVSGLAPAQLQAGTLTDALRRITERSGAELGIGASFGASGPERPLPAATEVVLLRTGQEALANVRKHAAAGQVAVRLCYAAGSVRLEVTDDGAGFDPAVVNGGYGLRGMRVRVDEAGGRVTVRSSTGKGTSVLVEVPG